MEPISYRQRFPRAGSVSAGELVSSLELTHADAAVTRPYTIVNFVMSADGRTVVQGQSRALSDSGDRELFRALRERADAVLAGTRTMAAEDYGRMLPAVERRERRRAAGRPEEPLAVMITRSGEIPLGIRLFHEPDARAVVFSPSAPPPVAAAVSHEPFDQTSTLARALSTLRSRYQVQTLLCEGGPTLFSALLRERLVDELFLTLTPMLAGGPPGPAVLSGPPLPAAIELELTGLLQREGSLFLRYRIAA